MTDTPKHDSSKQDMSAQDASVQDAPKHDAPPEGKPDDTAAQPDQAAMADGGAEKRDAVDAPEDVIEAEWRDATDPEPETAAADERPESSPQSPPESPYDQPEPSGRPERDGADAASGAAALAMAAAAGSDGGDADEPGRGVRRIMLVWLVVVTAGLLYVLYVLIAAPEGLRSRMALETLPAVQRSLTDSAAAAKSAKASADAVAAIQESQTRQAAKDAEFGARVASMMRGFAADLTDFKKELAALREQAGGGAAAVAASSELTEAVSAARGAAADAEAAAAANARTLGELTSRLTEMTARHGELSARLAAMAALEERLAALEARSGKSSVQALAKAILALNDLRTGVASGKPFDQLLTRAQAVLPDAKPLTEGPWTAFATSGLPGADALLAEIQAISVAIGQDELKGRLSSGESWLDRAVGGVVDRVKVRRVGAGVEGDGAAAVAARAEAALTDGDLPKAIAEVEQLEGSDAARFAAWLERARAADAAPRDLDAVEEAAILAADGA